MVTVQIELVPSAKTRLYESLRNSNLPLGSRVLLIIGAEDPDTPESPRGIAGQVKQEQAESFDIAIYEVERNQPDRMIERLITIVADELIQLRSTTTEEVKFRFNFEDPLFAAACKVADLLQCVSQAGSHQLPTLDLRWPKRSLIRILELIEEDIFYKELVAKSKALGMKASTSNISNQLNSLEQRGCITREIATGERKGETLIRRTVWGRTYLKAYKAHLKRNTGGSHV